MSLAKAMQLALGNPITGLPRMAALIYDKKYLVSYGLNSRKSHPLQAKFAVNDKATCIHAEIAALANARQSVEGMTMYVARVYRNNKPAMAKPCEACRAAIIEFGLKDVEWTT